VAWNQTSNGSHGPEFGNQSSLDRNPLSLVTWGTVKCHSWINNLTLGDRSTGKTSFLSQMSKNPPKYPEQAEIIQTILRQADLTPEQMAARIMITPDSMRKIHRGYQKASDRLLTLMRQVTEPFKLTLGHADSTAENKGDRLVETPGAYKAFVSPSAMISERKRLSLELRSEARMMRHAAERLEREADNLDRTDAVQTQNQNNQQQGEQRI